MTDIREWWPDAAEYMPINGDTLVEQGAIKDWRPYQIEGMDFLYNGKRRMNKDQPGMGKTGQGAVVAKRLAAEANDGRGTLVVCPGYLVKQWADYLAAQFPQDKIVYAGSHAGKVDRLKVLLASADWTVINKEMLRTHPVVGEKYCSMILDEAHHFRNRTAQQSKQALQLSLDIENVIELTATPIKKDPDDLFMQLAILDHDVFSSYYQFCNTYLSTTNNGYGVKVTGIRRPQALKQTLGIYALGRTYKEVDLQLPRLFARRHEVMLSDAERLRYNTIRDYWRDQEKTYSNYISALQALRRITACEEKIEEAAGIAEDAAGPTVSFCWYIDTAKALHEKIGSDNSVLITGDVDKDLRPVLAKSGKHVVATIPSMSEGVDLSHCTDVSYLEEDYTPGSRVQSLARVRRWSPLGEPNERVLLHYIIVKNSVDEVVHRAVESRGATINTIMQNEFMNNGD